MPSVPSYLKNVAKSFGYAMGDTLMSYNPVVVSIAKESKETASDIYQSIKSFSFDGKTIDEKAFKGTIKNTINDVWNNFKDDLKSGNWYNKERKNQADEAMMKSLGFDFDLDFDFNLDEDWGDDEESADLASTVVKSDANSTKQIIESVDAVGYKIAASAARATTEAADYIVSSNNQASKAIYNLTSRGFGSVVSALGAINETISAFAKIGEPLSTHMQNSAVFYTNTTKSLNEINQTLHQIEKNTTPAKLATDSRVRSEKNTFSDIFSSDTGLSISSYVSMIKDTFKDNKDMIDMAINFVKGYKSSGSDGGGSFGKNISLMQFATGMITKVMLPKVFKESMKNFNEQIKYALSGGLLKLRDAGSNNIFIDILKDMILPQDSFKSKVNTGNYEKGPVAWDGYSRQALTHVIPVTLLGIYSALTGSPMMSYDYEKGKFVQRSSIELDVKNQQKRYAREAGGDFREGALDKIRGNKNLSKQDRERLTNEIEEFFYQAFMKGGSEVTNVNKSSFDYKKYGLSEDTLAIIRQLIAEDRDPNNKNRKNRHGQFFVENQIKRDEYGNYIRREESSGMSIQGYLYNGFPNQRNKKGAVGTDEYDHSISFYLQGIYQYTGYLADNIDFIAGTSRRVKKRKGLRKGAKFQDIHQAEEELKKQAGEKSTEEAKVDYSSNNQDYFGLNMDDEDLQKDKEKADRMKKAKTKAKSTFEKLTKFATGGKEEKGSLKYYYNRPFVAVANLLDRIGFSLDKLIWGDDDNPENGLYGYLFKKGDEFKKWLENKFKVKENLNKLKTWLFGDDEKEGVLSKFKNETSEKLRGVGRWFGNTAKKVFGKERFGWEKPNVSSAAYGRKVTETGLVAVSEGELIIPSEFNPFYHGPTNKKKQIRDEQRVIDNFYGAFRDGGTVGKDGNQNVDYKERARNTKERLKKHFEEKGYQRKQTGGYARTFIKQGFNTLGEGFSNFFHAMFGEGDEETIKKDNTIIKSVTQNIFKEMGESKGAMGAGAIIGAGASILTGAVVGPLFGAAIGAGAGLIVNSKTVQKILFGDVIDEKTGEVSGGLLSKNVSNFMKKSLPDMGKGAVLGGVAGLFMGSPVMGAVLGSVAGYVKSSDKAKKYLFGDDKSEGLISKELQEKVKKAVPNMSAGMILGALAGPFGMIPNLALGAGLGFLSTSEEFHTYMFGDGKDDKGLAGMLKEKVFDNLDETFHNLNNAIKGIGKNLIKSLNTRIKDFFTKRARAYQDGAPQTLFGRLIGGGITLTGRAVKGATNAVGGVLGGINRRVRGFNLARGYGVYDREKKRNLYAGERAELRTGRAARSSEARLDSLIAGFNSKEELEEFRSQLQDIQDPRRVYRREANTAMSSLYANLQGMDPKRATKIAKALESGKLEKIQKMWDSLTPEEKATYGEAIQEAMNQMSRARDAKSRSISTVQRYLGKGIDLSKAGTINSAIDRVNYELQSDKFSPEEQEKKKTETFRERVIQIFSSIDKNIAAMSGGEAADPETTKQAKKQEQKNEENKKEKSESAKFIQQIKSAVNGEDEDKKTVFTDAGPLTMVKDKQNNWVEVKNDSNTDNTRKKLDQFYYSIGQLPLIGKGVRMMGGLFGKFSEKLFGDKEGKKKGIFSKILDFLGGENGPLNWITSWLSGSKIGMGAKAVKSMLSKISLKSVFTNVLAPALLIGGFSGLFDDFFKKLTNGGFGKGGNSNVYEDKETGQQLTKNADGTYTDQNGNIVDPANVSIREGDTSSFSEKLKYNTVRGVLTNKSSVASKVLGKVGIVKKATSVAKTAISGIGDDAAAALARNDLADTILNGVIKFTDALKKIPKLSGIANYLDDMGLELAEKATTKLASSGAKSILNLASNAVIWAKIAFVIVDFTTGYEDARTTLGITEEPTFGQRIVSGILRAVKNIIPVIGTLLPDSVIVDVVCNYIGPALGIDSTELMKQREEAQNEVDQYNQAKGTNYTLEEYNKTVLKDYTWTERLGNSAKSTWQDIKGRTSNFVKGVKEKGFFGQLGSMASDFGTSILNSYNESGGGISGIFSGIGTAFQKLLPGVIGEIGQKNSEIFSLASQGKLSELWNVSLDDFSGGEINEDGITTAVPAIFSKIIGNIPLIGGKLIGTPIALVSKVFGKVKDFFGGIFDKISQTVTNYNNFIQEEKEYGASILEDPDSNFSDFFKFDDGKYKDGILGGFVKAVAITNRLSAIPSAILKKIGNGIKNTFNKITAPIKNSITTLSNNSNTIDSLAKEGKISELWNLSMEEDPENPVGGFTKAIFTIDKIVNMPSAAIHWVGGKIKAGFDALISRTKENYESMSSSIDTIKKFADEGDLSGIWSYTFEPKDGDPLKFIWSAGFNINRLFQSAVAIFNKIAGPIKNAIGKAKGFIDDVGGWVGDRVDDVKTGINNAKNWVGDKANQAFQGFKNWLSGGGSGQEGEFVSQLDPKYKKMKFGNSTVGQKGCAPAVASMVASKYGKSLSMDEAIQQSSSFQNENGTTADYFQKVLNAKGIGTTYLKGDNIPGQIIQNLANGQSVILLGKDKNNTSKENSPFGPNGHYVVATGLDKNGNIVINDPESTQPRVYNKNILKNANISISTNAGGSGSLDTENARKVWSYFTSNGYSPAATAGILANLQAESGVKPDVIQSGGKGPAAGIAQWESWKNQSGRWKQMADYAASRGYQWTELQPQLEFINQEVGGLSNYFAKDKQIEGYNVPATTVEDFKASKDPQEAAMQFEKAFERAGKPRMAQRIENAVNYYKLYENSEYTGNYTPESPNPNASVGTMSSGLTESGSTEDSSSSNLSLSGIISTIGSAFTGAFGKLLLGNSSSDSSTATNAVNNVGTVDYASSGAANVQLGPVPEGNGNAAQKRIVQYAESRIGKNQYTQDANLRTKVDSGYSDCSAFAQWAYKQAIGVDPGGYTGAQIDSPLLTTVDKGTTPNVDNLEAGDLLFFRATKPNGRTENVGHVEIYDGNGNVIGHGSGVGPKKKTLESYLKTRNNMGGPYIEAKRYTDIANASGGSSGLLLRARPGTQVYGGNTYSTITPINKNSKVGKLVSGGASSLITETTNMLNTVRTTATNQAKAGTISADTVNKLLQAIVDVLKLISTNTNPIKDIYNALTSYFGTQNAATQATTAAVTSKVSNSNSQQSDVDVNIRNLAGTLAAIAKG